MADRIHLKVVSAEGVLLDRMVSYLTIPVKDGSVGVLAGHMPMLCAINKGVAKCVFGQEEVIRFTVEKGVFNIADNEAVFLVSEATVISN